MRKKLAIILIIIYMILPLFSLIYTVHLGDKKVLASYAKLTDLDHIVKEVDGKFVEKLLDNNSTYVLMMGFERCPWCQALMPYYNEIGKKNNFKEICYLDILEMRTNVDSINRPVYDRLYQILVDAGSSASRIGAPTIFFVKDGILQAYHVGTVDSHDRIDGILPPMTSEQINELKNVLDMEFKKVASK